METNLCVLWGLSKMSDTANSISNALIVGRLSIERCQAHVAHLHALMHLCAPESLGMDELVVQSMLRVMENLESDLVHSVSAISRCD